MMILQTTFYAKIQATVERGTAVSLWIGYIILY